MTRVLVLYYSSYGHIETMAGAVAEGVREAGAEAVIKRVPELVPEEVAAHRTSSSTRPRRSQPSMSCRTTTPSSLARPTRFGNMPAQMKNFLDQTGGLWFTGKLIGKVGSVFTSSATQHGGQESTILSTHTVLLHQGMVIVGLPYCFQGQMGVTEITGGSPYGASTIAGPDGSRQPSANELAGARFQGRHVAGIAARLKA